MITEQQAYHIARKYLDSREDTINFNLVIGDEFTITDELGWVFFSVPKKYLETHDEKDNRILGNCSLLVMKEDGVLIELLVQDNEIEVLAEIKKNKTYHGKPYALLQMWNVPDLEKYFGKSFESISGIGEIEQILLKSGNHSRGIVLGRQESINHLFNAINIGGKIYYSHGHISENNINITNYSKFEFLKTE